MEHSGDVIVVGREKDASITTENGDIVVFGSLRGGDRERRNRRRSDDDDDLEGGRYSRWICDRRFWNRRNANASSEHFWIPE